MAADHLDSFGDEDFEQTVRRMAYHLWEQDGRPTDGEKFYWYKALEKCLRRRADEERANLGFIDPM